MTKQLPAAIAKLIDDAADLYGVPRPIARGIAWVESRGNPMVKPSDKGARGIFQLMPETAKALGVTDVTDPAQNVDAGVRYLASLIKRFGEADGVLSFNWGPGRVANFRAGKLVQNGKPVTEVPQQLKTYVSNVLERAELELRQMGGAVATDTPLVASASQSPPSPPPLPSHLRRRSADKKGDS